jgi:hypothetical protein
MKLIFSAQQKNPYRNLLVLNQIATIYVRLVIFGGHKCMTGSEFRQFATYNRLHPSEWVFLRPSFV